MCGCGVSARAVCGLSCGHTFFRTSDQFFQIHLEVKHMKSNSISVKYYFSLNKSVLNRACSVLRSLHKSKSRRLLGLSVVMPARQEEII